MSLGNMRAHGVRAVLAICQQASCGQSTEGRFDAFPCVRGAVSDHKEVEPRNIRRSEERSELNLG
jgi:hypothetical protein